MKADKEKVLGKKMHNRKIQKIVIDGIGQSKEERYYLGITNLGSGVGQGRREMQDGVGQGRRQMQDGVGQGRRDMQDGVVQGRREM